MSNTTERNTGSTGHHPVPAHLIAEVNRGRSDALWKIIEHVLKYPSSLTLETIQLVFQSLSRWPGPPGNSQSQAKHGVLCLSFLGLVIHTFPQKARLLDQIIELVDPVCRWVNLCLDNRSLPPSRQQAPPSDLIFPLLFAKLASRGPRLESALFNSPAFSDLLIKLWLYPIPRGQIHERPTPGGPGCPLLWLVLKCLHDEGGRENLANRIIKHPKIPGHWVMKTLERANRLRDTCNDATRSSLFNAGYYINMLIEVTVEALSACPELRKAFTSARALTTLSSVASSMAALILPANPNVHTLCYTTEPAIMLGHAVALLPEQNFTKNYCNLASGDYLELLARIVAILPEKGRGVGINYPTLHATQALNWLAHVTPHPTFIEALLRIEPERRGPFRPVECQNVDIQAICDTLRESAAHGIAEHTGTRKDTVAVCNSFECKSQLTNQLVNMKKCSGCSSVFYCSRECQKNDWNTFHRSECAPLRVDYFCRKATVEGYSLSTRAYHLAYLESYYNLHSESIDLAGKSEFPDIPSVQIIPTLDFMSAKRCTLFNSMRLSDSNITVPLKSDSTITASLGDPQRSRLVRMLSEYQLAGTQRIVCAIFALGGHVAILMVQLGSFGGAYRVLNHAIRYEAYPKVSCF
ncbi:hypothetical protein D9611_012196 [Ephemerocybe angulata]|uniref:MYND-type domain-containing protein n=1 Tax=Ephemerocybe angulata TaxID=980116 RepID=A0A8H5C5A0_9AGAR|nr:hypothetical protein D9611_012196 [Tulosesus angulatus]